MLIHPTTFPAALVGIYIACGIMHCAVQHFMASIGLRPLCFIRTSNCCNGRKITTILPAWPHISRGRILCVHSAACMMCVGSRRLMCSVHTQKNIMHIVFTWMSISPCVTLVSARSSDGSATKISLASRSDGLHLHLRANIRLGLLYLICLL